MARLTTLLICVTMLLAACVDGPGSGERALPGAYKIRNSDISKIQFRMVDAVNTLRQTSGARPIELDPALNTAAATHSQDMSVQNRPWHFGSDGSSPIDRVARAGYQGVMLGENISETYETELETLAAWMEEPGTRSVILDPNAAHMGFSWFQEPNGKIWWTLLMGGAGI